MHVTVAICTYNRANSLGATLARLTELVTSPDFTWEVVVVDNGSSDDTPAVSHAFRGRLPLCCHVEPKPGLSNARNRAIAIATGDYVLWTDDDVLVDPGWMAAYVNAFRRDDNAAFFGGPVAPIFVGQPPRWIVDALPRIGSAFALRDLGDRSFQLALATLPFGANFAIRANVQRRHPYDAGLGQQRGCLRVGEETDVFRALLARGDTGWWVPDARVEHVIPPERQSWNYLSKYWYAVGVHAGQSLAHGVPDTSGHMSHHLLSDALRAGYRYRASRLFSSKEATLEALAAARMAQGRLDGFCSRSLS